MTLYRLQVMLYINPDQDEWMETETLPEMTINIPNVFDSLGTDAAGNVQSLNLGTVWNTWNNNLVKLEYYWKNSRKYIK